MINIILEIVTGIVVPIIIFILGESKKDSASKLKIKEFKMEKKINHNMYFIINPKEEDVYFRNLCIVLFIIVGFYLFYKIRTVVLIFLIISFEIMIIYDRQKRNYYIIIIPMFILSVIFFNLPYLQNGNVAIMAVCINFFQFISSLLWMLIIFMNIIQIYVKKKNLKINKMLFISKNAQILMAVLATALMTGIVQFLY